MKLIRKVLKLGGAGLLVLAAVLAWTFTAARLDTTDPFPGPWPSSQPPASLSVETVVTGVLQSRAALAFRGGDFGDLRDFVVGGILIRHPRGNLLIDAGFGASLDEHVRTLPWMMQRATRYSLFQSIGPALMAAGIAPSDLQAIVLTHAHWDHTSGLEDLPTVRVWMAEQELGFVSDGGGKTLLARNYRNSRFETLDFLDGPYLSFPRSHDHFGDGSVVMVPAGGHTPGSTIVFVSLASGRKLALIGDLAWQLEGVDLPAERPLPLRLMVDSDAAAVREQLIRLHALKATFPQLEIVPAHDGRAWSALEQ